MKLKSFARYVRRKSEVIPLLKYLLTFIWLLFWWIKMIKLFFTWKFWRKKSRNASFSTTRRRYSLSMNLRRKLVCNIRRWRFNLNTLRRRWIEWSSYKKWRLFSLSFSNIIFLRRIWNSYHSFAIERELNEFNRITFPWWLAFHFERFIINFNFFTCLFSLWILWIEYFEG